MGFQTLKLNLRIWISIKTKMFKRSMKMKNEDEKRIKKIE